MIVTFCPSKFPKYKNSLFIIVSVYFKDLFNITNTGITVFFNDSYIISNLKACYLCCYIRTHYAEFTFFLGLSNKGFHILQSLQLDQLPNNEVATNIAFIVPGRISKSRLVSVLVIISISIIPTIK
jgi:hypothetical protein